MAGMIEVARATVTIVPNMEGAQATITKDLTGVTTQASEKAGTEGGSKFGENFGKALKTTGKVIGAALTAATGAVIATGKAFLDGANSVSEYGDTVDKTSQKLGVSTKAYQEWDYVMNIAGTSMQNMQMGMKTLTNKLDDAKNGSKDAQAMFAKLGISMEDLNNMSREDIFEASIYGFQQMADSTERAALANSLFGRSGQELTPLFNMTNSETRELIANANELGMIMSDDGVKAAADYKDGLTTLQGTLTGLKNNMISGLMPGITSVMNGLSKLFAGEDGVAEISEGMKSIVSNLTTLAPALLTLAQSLIMGLLEGFGPMLPQLVSGLFDFINLALSTITTMIPQLTPIITQGLQGIANALGTLIPVLIPALFGVVQGLLQWLADGNQVKLFLDGIIAMVSELTEQFALILPVLLPAVINILGQVIDALTSPDNLMMVINATLVMVGAIVMALVEALPEIGGVFVKLFTNIIGQLKIFGIDIFGSLDKFFNDFWPKEKAFFGNLLNNIKQKMTEIWLSARDWFTSLPSKIKSAFTNIVKVFTDFGVQAKSWGQNILVGMWNGLNDKISWIKEKIKSMGAKITEAIKGVFGIHSPSRLMRDEVGHQLAAGLAIGWDEGIEDVAGDMATNASLAITPTVASTLGSDLGTTNNIAGSPISINVYGAEGQSVNELANKVAIALENMVARKGAVYA